MRRIILGVLLAVLPAVLLARGGALADVDAGRAPWPRILVVPAFTDPVGDPTLRKLIDRVHTGGGLIFGVCAGSRVLTHTGVLAGRRATSFWSDLPGLRHDHPETTWISGQRWVRDGGVLTTAGVSSGILGALRLVREFAGPAEEQRIGGRISYPGWDSGSTTIPVQRIALEDHPYPLYALMPWFQPRYGLGLTDGVPEIEVAAAAELYGGVAFTAHVIPVAEGREITTAHGFRLLTTPINTATGLDRLIVPGATTTNLTADGVPAFLPRDAALPGDSAFDPILRDIARTDGPTVARTAAKYIEYPTPPLPARDSPPWRIIGLIAALSLLTVAAAVAPYRLSPNRILYDFSASRQTNDAP